MPGKSATAIKYTGPFTLTSTKIVRASPVFTKPDGSQCYGTEISGRSFTTRADVNACAMNNPPISRANFDCAMGGDGPPADLQDVIYCAMTKAFAAFGISETTSKVEIAAFLGHMTHES